MNIFHHFGGGVYSKETHVKAGQILVQHKHEHAHLSILAYGDVEVMVDGQKMTMTAPACLTIEGGKHHGIRALTDVVWFCIHATDCTNESEVDGVLIVDSDPDQMVEILDGLQ